jgi:L-ascorbate metabolism protein UlaG (beta-lactamase superfamily)
LAGIFLAGCLDGCATSEVFVKNPNLKTIRPDFPGNRMRNGRFEEPYMSDVANTPWPLIRWGLTPNPKAKAKHEDTYKLPVQFVTQLPPADRDYLIWLGHASFLLHVQGYTLLTDPCLTAPPFMKRLAPVPLDIRSVPVDFLVVSHGHYDHLDAKTLAQLSGNSTAALVPLNLGSLITGANPRIAVQEAGWYQQYQTPEKLKIILLPAKHWNRRSLTDFNKTLWGSFVIRWKDKALYFAGDTGYDAHFAEIAKWAGPIDYALLPIGAYDPPFIMQPSHLNPAEALRAFKDLGAKTMIPMHYGTFDLSDEPVGEPVRWLRTAVAEQKLENAVKIPAVGEVVYLDQK